MDKSPQDLYLPYSEWRGGQDRAIDWTLENNWFVDPSPSRRVKVLEAPTGTGKTGYALAVAQLAPYRTMILCATKLEQEQYEKQLVEDCGVVSVVGRNNFHCNKEYSWDVSGVCGDSDCDYVHADEAACTTGYKCPYQADSTCHYFSQIADARLAKVVITNYAYGLSMLNYTMDKDGRTALGKFDLIICDEAHLIDQQLENFVAVKLSRWTLKRHFGIELPYFNNNDVLSVWSQWAKESTSIFENIINVVDGLDQEDKESIAHHQTKKYKIAKQYLGYMEFIAGFAEEGSEQWIVEEDTKRGVEFQPVWLRKQSRKVLWELRGISKFIAMSGTICDEKELAKKVGLNVGEYEFLRLPYIFPPEHRPIILAGVGKMGRNDIDLTLPNIAESVDAHIAANFKKKILIHTWSYKIAQYLMEQCEYADIFFTHDSKNRARVLGEFKEADAPAVLVSPSMDKAVDLPGDECELIIICKLPFPYLGTKVMRKRLKQSQSYYNHETLSSLIQMAGRGVRTEEDICPTIILDSGAGPFLSRVRAMTPEAIKEAIVS